MDHNELSASWIPNIMNAFFVLFLLSQIMYKEIPIKRYNSVQTGPKTQLGGLKNGLFKVTYHVETEDTVKTDPIIPANWQIIIEAINLK